MQVKNIIMLKNRFCFMERELLYRWILTNYRIRHFYSLIAVQLSAKKFTCVFLLSWWACLFQWGNAWCAMHSLWALHWSFFLGIPSSLFAHFFFYDNKSSRTFLLVQLTYRNTHALYKVLLFFSHSRAMVKLFLRHQSNYPLKKFHACMIVIQVIHGFC